MGIVIGNKGDTNMIGSDYELFLSTGGVLIPVPQGINIGKKGGKHVPLEHGTMHRDNIMVELCPNPASTVEDMVTTITSLTAEATDRMSAIMGENVELVFRPTAMFGADALNSRWAMELGCDCDFLAVDGTSKKRKPFSPADMKHSRFCGGHLHMSYGNVDTVNEPLAAHLCDLAVGTLEVTMGSQGDRRGYYGLPSLHRRRKYGAVSGVEYRTLSNMWLDSPERIAAISTNALSTEAVLQNESPDDILDFLKEQIPLLYGWSTLEKEDAEQATAFLTTVADTFPNYDWRVGA